MCIFNTQLFLGGASTSVYYFFHLSICRTSYLRNPLSSDHDFWHTCVKWWYPAGVFFHFLKILIFWAVRGGGTWGKRAKNGLKLQQNLSGVLHISGTMHHMTVICGTFVVLYLQMFFFSFFQNFDFFGGTCSYIRQFLAILWTFELLLHFDQLFSSN